MFFIIIFYLKAEIRAEETNPPHELVALASVEDEVEISSAGGGATISQGAGAVSPRVDPELGMYPTGRRL